MSSITTLDYIFKFKKGVWDDGKCKEKDGQDQDTILSSLFLSIVSMYRT